MLLAVEGIAKYAQPDGASAAANAYLGVKTVVQGMVIVFLVLILLSLIVMMTSKIVRACQKKTKDQIPAAAAMNTAVAAPAAGATAVQAGTIGRGELVVEGVDSEEEVAVIMAAVAAHNGATLDSLEFKSIKRV